MKVFAQFMYEEGRPLPKWREGLEREKVVEGKFVLAQAMARALNSHVMMASLFPSDGSERIDLYRAEVLYMKDEFISVTGQQHDPVSNKYMAQTWLLEVLAAK